MSRLHTRDLTLAGERMIPSPMAARDWPLILAINNARGVGC